MSSNTLSSRVARILSGGINALIKAIEESTPENVMEETIKEIDSALADVRSELGKAVASKHLANKRLAEENNRHSSLSESIQVALNEGRDDLAEAAISKQMDIEVQLPILEASINEFSASESELEKYIDALKAKKREMREELKQFIAHRTESKMSSTADSDSATAQGSVSQSVVDKVEVAQATFDRIMESQTNVPKNTNGDSLHSESQLAELEKLSRNNRIKERLAKLKSPS